MTATGGERLDLYLVRLGWAASRREARDLIERRRVRVNGRLHLKGALVTAGDTVEVAPDSTMSVLTPAPEMPLSILFEDKALLVIDKAGLIPCHPLRGGERGTVMNAVVARFPETGRIGEKPREGGLIHRLDNGTSGALLVARTGAAFMAIRAQLRAGTIERRYKALVAGALTRAIDLDAPVGHHRVNRRKMVAVGDAGSRTRSRPRPALTRIEPLRRCGGFTLVAAIPRGGLRHQIRVHLAAIGHPIAGDALYGGPELEGLAPGRFWLHLRQIALDSPSSGQIRVEAPLPTDLARALLAAGKARP